MAEIARYLGHAVRKTIEVWDGLERAVALILTILSAIGYIGYYAGWWQSDQVFFGVGAVAAVSLLGYLLFSFFFTVPARIWAEAQSPPFSPNIGECRIELMETQFMGADMISASHVLRLDFWNYGPPGPFRAFLVRIDGVRRSSSRIPLPWTLEPDPAIFLPTDTRERSEDPVQVKIGYLTPPSVVRKRPPEMPKGDTVEAHQPFTFKPAFVGGGAGDPVSPGPDGELGLLLRVGREDINMWASRLITVFVLDDGKTLACRSADVASPQ